MGGVAYNGSARVRGGVEDILYVLAVSVNASDAFQVGFSWEALHGKGLALFSSPKIYN